MPPDKAQLARIRDNQRRSRARRKEYLQDIEAKLRKCELQGVEASAQVQVAARRVADENRKLRELLAQNGVLQEGIDAYIQSSTDLDVSLSRKTNDGVAVQRLQPLLARQKCCPGGDSTQASSCGQTKSCSQTDINLSKQELAWPVEEDYKLGPSSKSSASTGNVNDSTDWPDAFTQELLAHPLNISGVPQYDINISKLHNTNGTLGDFSSAFQHAHGDTALTDHFSSCAFATDMITSMAGGDPATIRTELGCAPGTECEVNNSVAFSVMDKYTKSGALDL